MKSDLVSIIIPVYNSEEYISRCLDSLINQTYKNIEIVVVDDGSKDRALDIVNKYKDKDKRVKIYSQENQGPSEARNKGIEKCIGKYIMFVDADDYVNADMVRCMVENINNEVNIMVTCDNSEIWNDRTEERRLFANYGKMLSKENVITEIANGNAGLVCGKLFNRSIVEKYNIRFDKNISMCEDQVFFLNIAKYCDEFIHVSKSLYFYDRRNENSITIKYKENAIENQVYVINSIEEILLQCKLENHNITAIINNRFIDAIHDCITNEVLDTKITNLSCKINNIKMIISHDKLQQIVKDIDSKSRRDKIIRNSFKSNNYLGLYIIFYIFDKIVMPSKKCISCLIKR